MKQPDMLDAALGPATVTLGLWEGRVLLYLRVLAGFLLLKTVYSWLLICGVFDGSTSRFEMLSTGAQAAVIWAAIMNPVAAVGLWLGAAWGVVLWLATTLVQVIINAWTPEGIGSQFIVAGFEVLLVIAYAVLAFKAAGEGEET
ncbi:DUF6163 family protein [Ancylobacter terrae]|uniref:DUF6163 family protein n=1 Tax=Ancylobacter sp. sgz301288 TaxID=3342077 RepID=UPI003859F4A9